MKRRILTAIRSLFDEAKHAILTRSIEWYRTESDLILGFRGKKGYEGVYCYWLNQSDTWEFCYAGTKEWDRYHQKVYYQGRADPINFNELKGKVPPNYVSIRMDREKKSHFMLMINLAMNFKKH